MPNYKRLLYFYGEYFRFGKMYLKLDPFQLSWQNDMNFIFPPGALGFFLKCEIDQQGGIQAPTWSAPKTCLTKGSLSYLTVVVADMWDDEKPLVIRRQAFKRFCLHSLHFQLALYGMWGISILICQHHYYWIHLIFNAIHTDPHTSVVFWGDIKYLRDAVRVFFKTITSDRI